MADDKKTDDVEFDDEGNEIKKDDKAEGADDETAPKDKDIEKEGDDEEEGDDAGDDTEDVDVPVRGSAAASHVITRQKKTIEKLRDKKEGDSEDGDDDEGDEEKPTPDISAQIQAEVERQNKPLKDHLTKTSDDRELQDLFKSTPNALKYKNRIKTIMNHPAYSQVPPRTIYRDLAFDSAAKSGAAAKDAADTEAGHSKTGGRSKGKTVTGKAGAPSVDDVASMTDEEMEEMKNKALSGDFVPK